MGHRRPLRQGILLAVLLALPAAAGLARQTDKPPESGQQLFRTYCASCHGATARGDGPAAAEFRKPVPDLTGYTARNGGVFPGERLRQIIDGRGTPAHGSRDMPVWGDAFRTREGLDAAEVMARIDAIVRYLRGIQARGA